MKYISLFAGVGGFDYALNQLGHECIYANDFDKYCKIIYDKNFEHKLDNRSLTEVRADELPDFDLLVGGFPCQSFSIAGKRSGFNDTRGTLFFDVARIVKEKRPKYIILENVKGLLSHDSGRTFKTILSTLTELYYDIQTMVLNSKNFGVPQNRERVFIVGHLRGISRPKVFPIGEDANALTTKGGEQTSDAIVSRTLTATDAKMHLDGNYIRQMNNPVHSNDRVYATEGISPTLNTMQGGNRQPFVMRHPLKFLQRNQKNIEGDYSFTVDTANTGGIKVNSQIRRLTPVECERLQGFPDGWTEGVSDTQRYKMMGNAVTTNVVYEVARRLVDTQ